MITKHVNTNTGASVGDQDGSTDTAGSTGTAAFATLGQAIEWIVANDATLSDDYTIKCRGTNADTANVSVTGITLNGHTLTVEANRDVADGFYDGNEVISSSHYRRTCTSGDGFVISVGMTVDGIQVEDSAGSFRAAIRIFLGVPITIKNCRVRNAGSTRTGIGNTNAIASDVAQVVEGNLIVGFNTNGIEFTNTNFRTGSYTIRKNTIYGDGSSVGININFAASGTPTASIVNNAIANCGASADFSISGTGTTTYNFNATEGGGGGTTNEIDIGTLTDAWTDPGTAANDDFTIKDTSSNLYNSGVSATPTTDCRDITYVTNDIGAFAFVGAGGDTVTTASTTHATVSDAATLAQTHLLVAIDATQAHTADEASFVQTNAIVVDGTIHGHDAGNATLSQTQIVSADATSHWHDAATTTVSQTHILAGDDATHDQTAENTTFAIQGALDAAAASHGVESGNATFAQTHAVVGADASHDHTAAAATLAQTHILEPDDQSQSHAPPNTTAFVSGLLLVVQDAAHGHTADNTAFVQTHLLVGIDAEHGHTAGEDTLAQLHALVAANATHGIDSETADLDSLVPGPSTLNTATLDARRPGVTFDVTTGRSVSV